MASATSNQAVIAAGGTTSTAIQLGNITPTERIIGLIMPAAFTGTSLTFQVSNDDSTYVDLYDNAGTQVSVTVSTSRAVSFKADHASLLSGWNFIKIISGSTEATARTIIVVVK